MTTPPADHTSNTTNKATDNRAVPERDGLGIQIDDSAGDAVVVRLRGEIDTLTSTQVWQEIQNITQQATPGTVLIMDLTGVVFLDSLGITTLLNLHQQASQAQVVLRVVTEPTQFARRVLHLAGLTDILAIYDSVSQASTPHHN